MKDYKFSMSNKGVFKYKLTLGENSVSLRTIRVLDNMPKETEGWYRKCGDKIVIINDVNIVNSAVIAFFMNISSNEQFSNELSTWFNNIIEQEQENLKNDTGRS